MLKHSKQFSIILLIICLVLLLTLLSLAAYEPFKVKLTLFERFVAMTLLPAEGSYLTLKIVRDLQMELSVTEEEAKLAGLYDVVGGGTDAENWEAVPLKEIVFGDIAKKLLLML